MLPSPDNDDYEDTFTEAYEPESRRDALAAHQAQYPALFPLWQLDTNTLTLFATGPSQLFLERGLAGYWDYVDKTPADPLAYWDVREVHPPPGLFDVTLRLAEIVKPGAYADTSINNMWLYKAKMRFSVKLSGMTDGRPLAIIKSQAIAPYNYALGHSVFEFTNEVLVARLLNTLVTGFRYTVTPHFTTFLGSFACNEITKIDGTVDASNKRLYAIYERADTSFKSFLLAHRETSPDVAEVGTLVFQVLVSLEAAARLLGFAHNDAHFGNVMIRAVKGTAYHNRIWAYKRAGHPNYYFLAPQQHKNNFVEIIDLGRATIMAEEPSETTAAQRFARDARDVVVLLTALAGHWQKRKDGHAWKVARPFLNAVVEQLSTASQASLKEQFLREWPESTLGRVLFTHLRDWDMSGATTKLQLLPPLVVSVTPEATLVDATGTGSDVVASVQALKQAWHNNLMVVEYTTPLMRCVTCLAREPRYVSVNEEALYFCGRDCHRVHYGVYHSVDSKH